MTAESPYDVIVLGGGPAGSTAAALLAENGRRVLLLEKEKFPRYHIGESLLPYCYFTLRRLGLIDRLDQSRFPKKHSVQFVGTSGRVSRPFYFFQHMEHPAATTWQVLRSEFDLMLLDNARARGVEVREQTTARRLIEQNGAVTGVRAIDSRNNRYEFQAPLTIDATGRNALAGTRNRWRVRDPVLNKMALWTYFKGTRRDSGLDEGATTIAYVPEKGWFWHIPLPDDRVSVGLVAEKDYLFSESRDHAEIFRREIDNNPWIKDHLAPGEPLGRYWVTAEFSYRSRYCAADGLLLAGDAFAFLDPVFSSGVFLALKSGEMAADAAEAALQAGDVSAGRFADYGERFIQGLEAMRKLVYVFYDPNFSFGSMLKKYPQRRADLTDCLIGNLDRDFNALFSAVAEFAQVPEALPYGRPLPAGAKI